MKQDVVEYGHGDEREAEDEHEDEDVAECEVVVEQRPLLHLHPARLQARQIS